jgi:methionyl-tRNA formyltransferase
MSDPKRILAFVDKWIGREMAHSMIRQFPDDNYVFVVGPNEQLEICEVLTGHDVRRNSQLVIQKLRARQDGTFDWLLNLWGHNIFHTEDLSLAEHTLNVHPGALPQVRGSDPIVWTIRDRIKAKASLHQLVLEVDAGPIFAERDVPYALPITGGELYDRVIRACVDLFKEKWPYIRSNPQTFPQMGDARTHRRKELEPDRRLTCDETILKLLAHDFSDSYRAILTIDGTDYLAKLVLTPCRRGE